MAAQCKHVCVTVYDAVKNAQTGLPTDASPFDVGFKYCKLCEFYTRTIDVRCQCCTRAFRTSARWSKKRRVAEVARH
jgi:hypothetical protein